MSELEIEPATEERTVLLVDDDPGIRDALAESLGDFGYRVIGVSNGHEGLQYLRTSPRPHAVLLDLFMPAMNGWEFAREVAKSDRLAKVPIIVITAVEPHWGYPMSNHCVVRKPIRLEDLLPLLRSLCE